MYEKYKTEETCYLQFFSVFSIKNIFNFLISLMSCCKNAINIRNNTMPQTPDTYIKHIDIKFLYVAFKK